MVESLAVMSVFAFHAFPEGLQGGFIGVNSFFVISGYLISTIIFSEFGSGHVQIHRALRPPYQAYFSSLAAGIDRLRLVRAI